MKTFINQLHTHEYHTTIGNHEGKISSDVIMREIKETVAEFGVGTDFGLLSPENKQLILDSVRGDLASLKPEESERFLNEYPEVKEFLDKNPE